VFGWGFASPNSVSSDGTHVWVADSYANAVIELNAATGALVKVLRGSRYDFLGPVGIDSDGTNVWVANESDGSVTGFPAG
jgi:DNA-binding beta-propeller fold protein YncE